MKRILIIEDDHSLAVTLKNFLKLNGFEVIHASDGASGIQMAFSSNLDAILCDINIPLVDGYQVHKVLSEAPSTYSIPFIFLTAKSTLKNIRTGMLLGADDYITKPFDFDDLQNALTKQIAKRNRILKVHEDKFQSLLNNSPHGTFVCLDNKFVEMNSKMSRLFGYSPIEMNNLCLNDIADADHKDIVTQAVAECISSHQKEFIIEFSGRDKYQRLIPLKLIGGFSFYKGKDSIVGSLVDLSSNEYRLKDTELSSSELEQLANAIELFSSDYNLISKDLVTKLSGIYSNKEDVDTFSKIELTEREQEVLREVCLGKSNYEIAEALFISDRTVEKHRSALVQKTGSKNMIGAVIFAIKNKLIQL